MSDPLVSIIIPARNEEKYLPGCLESIGNLDYPREQLEVIVVDNGSTDRTREIALSQGVRVLRDETRNVSGLRNYGAEQARGKILALVDADCLVSTGWLISASPYFFEMDVAGWGAPPKLPEKTTWVQRTWYLVRQKEILVQDVEWLETMNFFVRKDQFLALGGFNENLVTCEDVDLSYRLRRYGRIVSDSRIEVVHLGEAKTVKEFFKKEIWRGESNLSGLRSHGFSMHELPSLSIPVYFGLAMPLLVLGSVITFNFGLLVIFLLLYILPSLAVFIKVRKKIRGLRDVLHLFVLLQVYFLAGTAAVFKKAGKSV